MPARARSARCSRDGRRRRGANRSPCCRGGTARTLCRKRLLDQAVWRCHLSHAAAEHRTSRLVRANRRDRGSFSRPLRPSAKATTSVAQVEDTRAARFYGTLAQKGSRLPANMNAWKQKIVSFAGGLGAPGLFLISFLDSSVLTFPVINDLLLIELSVQRPARMPLYAAMAMLGSTLGCVLLYFLAKKGGEALFHRKAGPRGAKIRQWVEKNGFAGMLVAALLPPPTPFKFFVLAAGVEVPLLSFTSAIALARAVRYFAIGFLAVRYGSQALPFLGQHKLGVAAVVIVLVAFSYAISRFILR